MPFHPMLPPSPTRLKSQLREVSALNDFIRAIQNNFSLSTWLLIGGLLQTTLAFFIPRFYILLPTLFILFSRLAWTVAITFNLLPNPYLKNAIHERNSAQLPDADGNFSNTGASEPVVCFHLGAKINHPLGIFAPNAKELTDRFQAMIVQLDDELGSNGYLGGTSFQRFDNNGCFETVFLSYWRRAEDIHNFAYSPIHRSAWEWWNRLSIAESKHIGINHEIFAASAGQWETIYINHQPTLLGATTFLRKGDKLVGGTVGDEFIKPLIDASRGKLRTSAGRLGRDPKQLYEKHGYHGTPSAYD